MYAKQVACIGKNKSELLKKKNAAKLDASKATIND